MSRRRKTRKSPRSATRVVKPAAAGRCACPDCSAADFDPQDFIGDLVSDAAALLKADDPLDAELFGATFMAAGELAGDGFAEALTDGIVPAVAALATPESLAVLLALDAAGDVAPARVAADRLADAGVAAPGWIDELRQPVQAGRCRRLADPTGAASVLICSFDRATRSHGFVVYVDHDDCGAAADIMLIAGEDADDVIATIRKDAARTRRKITVEIVDPAEFRWQVEQALDARAAHDQDEEPALDGEDGDYHMLAALLRSRMRALPESSRPPAPHGDERSPASGLAMLTQFAAEIEQINGTTGRRTGAAPKLPAKRRKSGPAAPIYQIKVSLRGARPPIWRRLEVPADISLADLHRTIQVAFGWEDCHLHVFETAYGVFGRADRELGHRAEAPVTLEQVAPGAGDRLQYVYDFGDNWTHEIVVEKVLERQPVAYPRCTGGRRAAPPEDCGGIWGYADLVEVVSDPGHPEHADQLEWMALDSADEFQPARFDAAEITRALTGR